MAPNKREYTDEERKKILQYIIDNDGFYNLRGNVFWKKMEQQKVVKRTWQSTKEHFRMKIINNLKHFNITKQNEMKILSGYNNTKTVGKTDNKKTHVPQYEDISFSDEEKVDERRRKLSTSSDDSDNLVIEVDKNKPSTSKKGFKKQVLKEKSKITIISDSEESISNENTQPVIDESKNNNKTITVKNVKQLNEEANETIDIVLLSPAISDENLLSRNVSSTNLDEECVDFSIVDDKKFLQAITKHDSNLVSCSSIVTFIKQYTDYYKICQEWTELYDRFVEILNKLELYDFLAPEIITKLQTIKEPLEKYRSDGFQEPQIEVLPIKFKNETFKLALAPDPDLIYLRKEQFELVTLLDNNRNKQCDIVEKLNAGEISQETVSDIIKRLSAFNKQMIDYNRNGDATQELTQSFNAGLIEDCLDVRIKEEDFSLNIGESEMDVNNDTINKEADNQLDMSDSIPLQPEIHLDASQISVNSIENSQKLEPLSTEELYVTNIVSNILEDNINESDLEFLTCESQV